MGMSHARRPRLESPRAQRGMGELTTDPSSSDYAVTSEHRWDVRGEASLLPDGQSRHCGKVAVSDREGEMLVHKLR